MSEAPNIIFMTSLGGWDNELVEYQQYSLNTWKHYAAKHGHKLVLFTESIMNTRQMRPTWQRWHVYDVLEKEDVSYNQVALVDLDTMVKWNAPDIFEASQDRYSGVKDNINPAWNVESILGYKSLFPDTELDWDSYINNGVVILPSKEGKAFCKKVLDFYYANQGELNYKEAVSLRRGSDQTPVNYLAVEFFGDQRNFLNKRFNMMHLPSTDVLKEDMYINHGYVWHFNGLLPHERINYMRYTWNKISQNY